MASAPSRIGFLIAVVAVAIGVMESLPAAAGQATAQSSGSAPALAWTACGSPTPAGFECAVVQVPLDYSRPGGRQIDLAVIRHAASDSENPVGTLFFNPGGPGGAGTIDLPRWLSLFPASVQARFDIVSWDPRGIGASTAVQCFATEADEKAFLAGLAAFFPVGAAEESAWIERYESYGRICEQRDGDLLAHVSTADTARDMDLLRQAVGAPDLTYLGVSYGTFLGAVYANMFPDKVRAMVLDGNVDPVAWTNGGHREPVLSTSLRLGSDLAAARTLSSFLDLCGEAAIGSCAFSAGDAVRTHAKFNALLERLKREPVTIDGLKIDDAAVVSLMNGYLFTGQADGGFKGWKHAGTVLQQSWVQANTPAVTPVAATAAVQQDPGSGSATQRYTSDQQVSAVQCAESPNARPATAFRGLAKLALARSGLIGPVQTWADAVCGSWQATAAQTHSGPWNQPTAHPILVIGNTYDPSTPYEGAVAMTKELANARLLTVDGYGHTTLLNPSDCANQYEADYLINATLPAPGTVCRQNKSPFQD
jgi:pimeloyl-ACP methyl ester carboxylesterase